MAKDIKIPPNLNNQFENEPTEKSFKWVEGEEKKGNIEKEADELLEEYGISDEFKQ